MMQIIRNTATAIIASSAHTATSLNLALHHCPRNSYLKWLGSRSPIVRQNSSLMFSSTDAPDVMKRIVLIGGGHAHVQGDLFHFIIITMLSVTITNVYRVEHMSVIKALNARAIPENVHVTLIDLQSNASYSGMVPGCVSKLYTLDQGECHVISIIYLMLQCVMLTLSLYWYSLLHTLSSNRFEGLSQMGRNRVYLWQSRRYDITTSK